MKTWNESNMEISDIEKSMVLKELKSIAPLPDIALAREPIKKAKVAGMKPEEIKRISNLLFSTADRFQTIAEFISFLAKFPDSKEFAYAVPITSGIVNKKSPYNLKIVQYKNIDKSQGYYTISVNVIFINIRVFRILIKAKSVILFH